MRLMLGIPRNSHKFFIEPLTNTPHIMTSLYGRYLKFVTSLETSSKEILRKLVRQVKRDCRTNTGRNLRRLMILSDVCDVDNIETNTIRKRPYTRIPLHDEWKVHIAKELINTSSRELVIQQFNRNEIQEMLQHILTS